MAHILSIHRTPEHPVGDGKEVRPVAFQGFPHVPPPSSLLCGEKRLLIRSRTIIRKKDGREVIFVTDHRHGWKALYHVVYLTHATLWRISTPSTSRPNNLPFNTIFIIYFHAL